MAKLWRFPGGLRISGHKQDSNQAPVADAGLPAELIIPLQQHIGAAPEVLVSVGDKVLSGQPLAKPKGYISAPVHATSSGEVIAIEDRVVPHPSGMTARCVIIKPDGRDAWGEPMEPLTHYTEVDPVLIRQRVREAGIVGLGGAAFPSAVKLNPSRGAVVKELILNAAECEPYITCDDLLMQTQADRIVEGLQVIRHALHAERCLIGVEDNKPKAIETLRKALAEAGENEVEVVPVPSVYPGGGEKQLVYTLTGKEVPSSGLPLDIGVVCHNVGTAVAVADAVIRGRPLIERLVTVTGDGVAQPQNLRVRIGTPFRHLIERCGGYAKDVARLIMGGPMMGFTVDDDGVPVIKATNCVLAGSAEAFPPVDDAMPCIRCGACMDACPVSLLPQQLYWYARAKDFDRVQDLDLFDCIECGCCSYVCPSHIPLVQYYRFAKSEIWAEERERRKADIARERHDFRKERLEREKQEQEERRRRKKEALKSDKEASKGKDDKAKQDAIQAALERAKQKRAAKATTPAEEPEPPAEPAASSEVEKEADKHES